MICLRVNFHIAQLSLGGRLSPQSCACSSGARVLAPTSRSMRWPIVAIVLMSAASAGALVPAAPLRVTNAPLSVCWLATDDNPKESFGPDSGAAPGALSFNENHYQAMLADVRRTQGYIEAIKQRLAMHPPGTMTVLDLGTGPYAVLAFADEYNQRVPTFW